jgi:hypothetical protein
MDPMNCLTNSLNACYDICAYYDAKKTIEDRIGVWKPSILAKIKGPICPTVRKMDGIFSKYFQEYKTMFNVFMGMPFLWSGDYKFEVTQFDKLELYIALREKERMKESVKLGKSNLFNLLQDIEKDPNKLKNSKNSDLNQIASVVNAIAKQLKIFESTSSPSLIICDLNKKIASTYFNIIKNSKKSY